MNTKLLLSIPLTATLFFLAGCGATIQNLAPQKIPENPSGIYTLSMSTNVRPAEVAPNTLRPAIVIDGKEYAMRPSPIGESTFDFDYSMPKTQNTAKYYYILRYGISVNGQVRTKEIFGDLQELQLTNRYIYSMESSRGRVGMQIPVIGRGFIQSDKVVIGGKDAVTQVISPNNLSFTIPALASGRSYEVSLVGKMGDVPIGSFFIDPSKLHIKPEALELNKGSKMELSIAIDYDAPNEGIAIEVTTDVPNSVIMPEIKIAEGARSVSVTLEGGVPGKGTLLFSASGFEKEKLPVVVK